MNRIMRTTGLLICIVMIISGLCACSQAAPTVAPVSEASSEPAAETAPEATPEATPSPVASEDVNPESGEVCHIYLGGAEDATTGMEMIDDTFNDDGSYRYEHITDDGMLCICEAGKLWNAGDASSPEEAAKEIASWILLSGEKYADVTVENNEEFGANVTYPVYIVSFTTGSNEDTWSWKAFTVATDTCGLVYAIGGPADFDEDMLALSDKYFPKLRVIDKDEGLETNDGVYKTDLYAYLGMNIDDVAVDFPDLQYDDSYKNSEGTTEVSEPADMMEKMSDGLALGGPFFTIDKSGTVVGVNYGGKTYCVCQISVGMPMSEAKELAKQQDFKFSRVEITHGTAKYVAIYDNGQYELCITSDEDGNTGKTDESDVEGNVDCLLINKL